MSSIDLDQRLANEKIVCIMGMVGKSYSSKNNACCLYGHEIFVEDTQKSSLTRKDMNYNLPELKKHVIELVGGTIY